MKLLFFAQPQDVYNVFVPLSISKNQVPKMEKFFGAACQ